MRSDVSSPARRPFPLIAATGFICVAELLGGIAAGIPDDKLWTSVVCLCALLGAMCVLIASPPGSAEASPADRSPAAVNVARYSLFALALVSALSTLTRWMVVDHGSLRYVDAMLRGTAYWSAMAALALATAAVGSRDRLLLAAITLTLIGTATFAAGLGVRDYLINVIDRHIAGWREFGTSTPDYYAAYLLVTAPISFAAYLSARPLAPSALCAICALLQLSAIVTTGSRFALISLFVEVCAFAVGLVLVRKRGSNLPASAVKLLTFAVPLALGALIFARPVLHRLQSSSLHADANSGAFRIWTWRGSLALARAYPALGTGPGLFQYDFPRYATAGFTRVAHSGYLQLLGEMGPLGLLAVAVAGGAALVGMAVALTPATADHAGDEDDGGSGFLNRELLLVGVGCGVLGMCVQNAIDSDWMVTISGATWFAALGLGLALAQRSETTVNGASAAGRSPKAHRTFAAVRRMGITGAGALAVLCVIWIEAGSLEQQGDLAGASRTAALDGEYAGTYGYSLASDGSQNGAALHELRRAAKLTPSPVEYRRLAKLQDAMGDQAAALGDVAQGLQYDPHSLELLLLGAQISAARSDQQGAKRYYAEMAWLQTTPYGTVPALGELVEYRYAFSDVALGEGSLRVGDTAAAIPMLLRGKAVLDAYRQEGGSSNVMRVASMGASAQRLDGQLQAAYAQCMAALADGYAQTGNARQAAAIRAEAAKNTPRFVHKPVAPLQ